MPIALTIVPSWHEAKLSIDLVPEALWGRSLRQQYPTQWKKLKVLCGTLANHKCQICGGIGSRHPVEVHEIWKYDTGGGHGVQTLGGLIALCPPCHAAKHYGRSAIVMPPSGLKKLNAHMRTVNCYSERELNIHIAQTRSNWQELRTVEWSQDLSAFFTEYKCGYCARTRDLRPAILTEDDGHVTSVQWVCRTDR
jgi:5-methylcytosine-specific restriction endonuclease McrA